MKKLVVKITGILAVLLIAVIASSSCSVNIGRDDFESGRERAERLAARDNIEICDCSAEQLLGAPAAQDEGKSATCPICGLLMAEHVTSEKVTETEPVEVEPENESDSADITAEAPVETTDGDQEAEPVLQPPLLPTPPPKPRANNSPK